MTLIQEVRDQRKRTWQAAYDLLKIAEGQKRDLSPAEDKEYRVLSDRLHDIDARLEQLDDTEHRAASYEHALAGIGTGSNPEQYRYGRWLLEQRANTVDSGTLTAKGRAPIGSDVQRQWFDLVRPQSRLLDNFGWRYVMTDAVMVDIPHVTVDGPATVTSESASITGNAGFDAESVQITPLKYSSYESVSTEVWEDADPSILDGYALGIVKRHSLAWEAALVTALELGTAVGGDAAFSVSLDSISDTIVTMQSNGSNPSGIVTTAAVAQGILKMKEAAGSTKPTLWSNDSGPSRGFAGSIFGVPLIVSSYVTATKAVVFDAADTVLVVRKAPNIEISRDVLFGTDSVAVRAISRFAAKLMNATGAYVLTDS